MISGKTTLIAHLGWPTESFKAPLIYNPWFESRDIDAVVVPMQAEYFSLEGLGGLIQTIEHVKKSLNPSLHLEGVLFCMYDPRTRLSNQVRGEVEQHLGAKVYSTLIPRNVRLSESPSHGKPILLYDLRSRGCQSYLELAREFIARQGDVRIGTEPDTLA